MIYSSTELAKILGITKVTINKYIKENNIQHSGFVKTSTVLAKAYDISLFEKFVKKYDVSGSMIYAPREVPKNVVPLHELDKLIFNQRNAASFPSSR